VLAGLLVGLISALSQIFGFPQFENALVFVVMAVVLLVRPAGLFGSAETA
jgi:branched-subunit amino acid ABC-type transport system permease component